MCINKPLKTKEGSTSAKPWLSHGKAMSERCLSRPLNAINQRRHPRLELIDLPWKIGHALTTVVPYTSPHAPRDFSVVARYNTWLEQRVHALAASTDTAMAWLVELEPGSNRCVVKPTRSQTDLAPSHPDSVPNEPKSKSCLVKRTL